MAYYCYDNLGRRYPCGSSGWYNWGRWLVLGLVLLAFFAFALLFSCITARRRRKMGRKPLYGTGWAAAGPFNPQHNYNPNYGQQQAPYQNNYNQPSQGGYYGQNQGYFGGQQTGVEMPSSTYQPPTGPPPNKH